MNKKLPTRLLDKLRIVGWNEYSGDNPLYKGNWVKDGIALKIQPARQMARMWHLGFLSPTQDEHRFIHEDKLIEIIESGKL